MSTIDRIGAQLDEEVAWEAMVASRRIYLAAVETWLDAGKHARGLRRESGDTPGPHLTNCYRVSTKPDGKNRWWSIGDVIPHEQGEVRVATDIEAALMRRIERSPNPPARWGELLAAMMADSENPA